MTSKEQKWVLIMGSVRRIGKSIALHLASKGYSIVAHYHTAHRHIEEIGHWHINLRAPYLLTQQFALLCKKGQIINILDTAICENRTQHLPYLLTKKALANLTELSAIDLAPHIKVNAVSPGVILAPENEEDSYLVEKIEQVPLGIKGEPNQIAEAVQYLLEAPFVTGQIIYIDGGQHL